MNVTGGFDTGGAVGELQKATITDSYVTGIVNGKNGVGGFIGDGSGTVTNCYSTSEVHAIQQAGGFIGNLDGGTYERCGAFGKVFVTGYGNGGFGGRGEGSFKTVDCYSLNTLSLSPSYSTCAGFVAHGMGNVTIENSYSLATANDDKTWGDFAYAFDHVPSIKNSFYNNASGKGIGNGKTEGSPMDLSPLVITQPNTIYHLSTKDGTPLNKALGINWQQKTCTLDIGDGPKDYVVPLSTTIYPDFCH